jgi:hypothetical protein
MSHGDIDTGTPQKVALRHAMNEQIGHRMTYREKRGGKEHIIEGQLVDWREADLVNGEGQPVPAVFLRLHCDDGHKRWTRAMAVTLPDGEQA